MIKYLRVRFKNKLTRQLSYMKNDEKISFPLTKKYFILETRKYIRT